MLKGAVGSSPLSPGSAVASAAPTSRSTLALTSPLAAAAGAPDLHSHPVLSKGSTPLPGLVLPRQQHLRPLGLQQPPDLLRSETLHLFRMWNLKDRLLLPLFQGPAELPGNRSRNLRTDRHQSLSKYWQGVSPVAGQSLGARETEDEKIR